MKGAMPTLFMVYNANGGILSALGDMVHKIVSPSTYPCSLCALTYGPFSMRREWRDYLSGLHHAKVFLYRDDLRSDPGMTGLALPAILWVPGPGVPEVLVSAEELDVLPDLAALIALVEERLSGVRN
jgi:hypothetical protein